MPADTQTPILGLSLGVDEHENRNWRILDAAIERIAKSGTIVPEDLRVEGGLEVTGDADIAGTLNVGTSIQTGTIQATDITASGMIHADGQLEAGAGLLVSGGTVTLPDASLSGAAFLKGAPLQGVWIGTPNTTATVIGTDAVNPTVLASVTLDATEEAGRWELVLAQLTLRHNLAVDAPPALMTTMLALTRGTPPGTVHQTRALSVLEYSRGQRDYPMTLVRWLQPTIGPEAQQWNLTAWSTTPLSPIVTSSLFGQLTTVQFR